MIVRKSKIQEWADKLILKATKRLEQRFAKEKAEMADVMDFEHSLVMQEKQIEIKSLQREITVLTKKCNKAESIRRQNKEQIKLNIKLTHDVIIHVKEFFDGSAEIYQTFSALSDQAERYNKLLEDVTSKDKRV